MLGRIRLSRSSHLAIRCVVFAAMFAAPLAAAGVTIPVLADASVYALNPDDNYGTTTFQGGLYTGTADFSEARFYLKFALPAALPNTQIVSATLSGTYSSELLPNVDAVHGIYLVIDDSWLELTLTWNDQPGLGPGPLATWDAALAPAPPVVQSFDVTAAVNQEYLGDGTISLAFAVLDTGPNVTWEYWASKEYSAQEGTQPFQLDITIAAVPEPASGLLIGLGLVSLAGLRRRR